MVLQERQPSLEEVRAEWMDALERALSGSDQQWAEFIRIANDSGPPFTPEEDAEDIAFILEEEAKRARGDLPPPVECIDPTDDEEFPEDAAFFRKLDSNFPEQKDPTFKRRLPTYEGRAFVRRLKQEFPEALHLYIGNYPYE